MRVIDAHTGNDVRVGDHLWNGHDRTYKVLEIESGFLSARMLVLDSRAQRYWVPLVVRWTHPRFFLQHVAFVPS